MGKVIDLTGRKFGRWTVIKRSYIKNKKIYWSCKCDCGIEKAVSGDGLRSGDSKGCGCFRKIFWKRVGERNKISPGLSGLHEAIASYKRVAKRRRFVFELTEKQFAELTKKDCYYCGAKPNNIFKSGSRNGTYIYNGLDRVDNTKGYTMSNVVPCCRICNHAKNRQTLQEYKDLIKRSYNKMFEGKATQ